MPCSPEKLVKEVGELCRVSGLENLFQILSADSACDIVTTPADMAAREATMLAPRIKLRMAVSGSCLTVATFSICSLIRRFRA